MTKDYIVLRIENLNVLGHKVKAVTELFSDSYLNSKRFESRCLRCCFYSDEKDFSKKPHICDYIDCNNVRYDLQTHFEL